jgi:prevent-host-death family protein
MRTLNIAEARAQLSKIVSDTARGKTAIIARNGRPVAQVVPFDYSKPEKIKFGTLKNKIAIPEDFDAPDQEIIEMFENSGPLFPRPPIK